MCVHVCECMGIACQQHLSSRLSVWKVKTHCPLSSVPPWGACRAERSQSVCPPYKLQLEECLSAEHVPTPELIQGYVKKVGLLCKWQGEGFVRFVPWWKEKFGGKGGVWWKCGACTESEILSMNTVKQHVKNVPSTRKQSHYNVHHVQKPTAATWLNLLRTLVQSGWRIHIAAFLRAFHAQLSLQYIMLEEWHENGFKCNCYFHIIK